MSCCWQVNRPRLDGFKQWLFQPGMLFLARQQWWGRERPRPTLHEGLDLCWYEDMEGRRRALDQTTVIPAPFAGTVVKISRDFLGQSIFLAHGDDPAPAAGSTPRSATPVRRQVWPRDKP